MSNSAKFLSVSEKKQLSRRRFVAYLSGLGLSSTLLPGILWAGLREDKVIKITKEVLQNAERLAGFEFTDTERDL
ncbi:MAG: hypothetical protein ACYSSO_13515, partial [Planctomycetota bacterium]